MPNHTCHLCDQKATHLVKLELWTLKPREKGWIWAPYCRLHLPTTESLETKPIGIPPAWKIPWVSPRHT